MSNKQLRRYLEEKWRKEAAEKKPVSSESSDEATGSGKEVTVENRFAFLADQADEASSEKSSGSEQVEEAQVYKKKSTKKKKKKKGGRATSEPLKNETVEESGAGNKSAATTATASTEHILLERDLFKFDSRGLDANVEIWNMLGQKNPPLTHTHHRRGPVDKIIKRRPDWPELQSTALIMVMDCEEPPITWFKFVHGQRYKEAQGVFWTYGQYDAGALPRILHEFPSHLDTLILLAEVFRNQEDYQQSYQATERGIFTCERSFAPGFQLCNYNHRLSYEVYENRAFFLLLHRHMRNLLDRRCFNTALNFGKLLFRLDPAGDPLAMILTIDTLALRARQYQYLLLFYENMKETHKLDSLPNFAYSAALAQFFLSNLEGDDGEMKTDESNKYLADAIRHFPTVLIQLLDKIGYVAEEAIDSNTVMCALAHERESEGIKLLTKIYVTLSHDIWNNPQVIQWLEKSVIEICGTFDSFAAEMDLWRERRRTHFVGPPRNVERLAWLLGITHNPEWTLVNPAPPYTSRNSYRFLDNEQHDPLAPRSFLNGLIRSLMPQSDHFDQLERVMELLANAARRLLIRNARNENAANPPDDPQ